MPVPSDDHDGPPGVSASTDRAPAPGPSARVALRSVSPVLGGTVVATGWGILLGNVLRGGGPGELHLAGYFALDNAPAILGGVAGPLVFLSLALGILTRRPPAPPRQKVPRPPVEL